MASNLLPASTNDGLQPTSAGLQATSDEEEQEKDMGLLGRGEKKIYCE